MDIGTGCAVIGGAASFAAIAISGLHGYFSSKPMNGNGYSAAQCKKDHDDIKKKFEFVDSEKKNLEDKTQKIRSEIADKVEADAGRLATKLDEDKEKLYAVLGGISSKIDDVRKELSANIKDVDSKISSHIDYHLTAKIRKEDKQ